MSDIREVDRELSVKVALICRDNFARDIAEALAPEREASKKLAEKLAETKRALYEVMKHHTPDDTCECCSCVHARELLKEESC